jgi:hypothetical protein
VVTGRLWTIDELSIEGERLDAGGDELYTGEDELKLMSQLPYSGWHPAPQYVELTPLYALR